MLVQRPPPCVVSTTCECYRLRVGVAQSESNRRASWWASRVQGRAHLRKPRLSRRRGCHSRLDPGSSPDRVLESRGGGGERRPGFQNPIWSRASFHWNGIEEGVRVIPGLIQWGERPASAEWPQGDRSPGGRSSGRLLIALGGKRAESRAEGPRRGPSAPRDRRSRESARV